MVTVKSIVESTSVAERVVLRSMVRPMLEHFDAVRGVGVGIGDASCCASARSQGGLRYGNSQAYKLDLEARGVQITHHKTHAEIVAYFVSESEPSHVFVELVPCTPCATFFQGLPQTTSFTLWWMFPYDTQGKNAWVQFHNLSLEDQIAHFNALLV